MDQKKFDLTSTDYLINYRMLRILLIAMSKYVTEKCAHIIRKETQEDLALISLISKLFSF